MSRKILQQYETVSAELDAQAINMQNYRYLSCQVSSSNGVDFLSTVTLEVSNDQVTWVTVTSTSTALNGASGTVLYPLIETAVGYVRVNVAPSDGSANIRIDYVLK